MLEQPYNNEYLQRVRRYHSNVQEYPNLKRVSINSETVIFFITGTAQVYIRNEHGNGWLLTTPLKLNHELRKRLAMQLLVPKVRRRKCNSITISSTVSLLVSILVFGHVFQ